MIVLRQDVAALSWEDRRVGLEKIIPDELIQEVLRENGKQDPNCPRLPGLLLMRFVLGLGLFCSDCYRQVFRQVRQGQEERSRQTKAPPGRTTLCEARKRLGVKALVMLCKRVVHLLASTSMPSAFYKGMRLMGVDGFVLDVPDSAQNNKVFGRPGSSRGRAAFPQVRVVALCELATHVMWHWLIKPCGWDERPMTHWLLHKLTPGMLLLWDRNFLSYQRLKAVQEQGAHLLALVSNCPVLKPVWYLKDGSYIAHFHRTTQDRKYGTSPIVVRVIKYTLKDDGRGHGGEPRRLLTTLLDAQLYPALELVELYHQRWEEELVVDEIKTHQMERAVLRSQTPGGVVQEIESLLLGHYVIRSLMFQAALEQGLEPLRMSFTGAIKILRMRMPSCPRNVALRRAWYQALVSEIGQETLPPRRNRSNPRVIKRKYKKWKVKRIKHHNPPQPTTSFAESVVIVR